jgi:hypothetical protein
MHFDNACIFWPFARDSNGQAHLRIGGQDRYGHRIVCERFNGRPPSSQHKAAHNCGNGHLGCVNGYHLRWATQKENSADMFIHGTCRQARLTENDVRAIIALAGIKPQHRIGKQFGVAQSTISRIINRKRWLHLRKDG